MTNKDLPAEEAHWLLKEIAEQKAEIERLQKREAQFAAALYAVKEVVAKDSPQWLLADQLARMMLSQPADEPVAPHFEMRGKCECGLLWQVGSGFAFEVKEVFCTCGRTVPVNRAAVKSNPPHCDGKMPDMTWKNPAPDASPPMVSAGKSGTVYIGGPNTCPKCGEELVDGHHKPDLVPPLY